MVPSLANKAFRWPRSTSSDKSLTLKPSRENDAPRGTNRNEKTAGGRGGVPLAPIVTSMSSNNGGGRSKPLASIVNSGGTGSSSGGGDPKGGAGAGTVLSHGGVAVAQKPRRTTATVYVGPEKQRFRVNRKLLCASSTFFSDLLEGNASGSGSTPHSQLQSGGSWQSVSLWLPGELPSMFALFVDWLGMPRHHFRQHLDDAVARSHQQNGERGLHDTHWALIRLHLFASHLGLLHLQDSAMDAIQDLYLSCDWDLPPALLSYLYTCCESLPAVRLRRWAVAMVAFSLSTASVDDDDDDDDDYDDDDDDTDTSSPISPASGASVEMHTHLARRAAAAGANASVEDHDIDDDHASRRHKDFHHDDARRFRRLIASIDELAEDYDVHLAKMAASNLDIRVKNPQLRIPANRLRNDERAFGFRECSFHSHRSTVGEKRCPHERKRIRALAAESDATAAAPAAASAPAPAPAPAPNTATAATAPSKLLPPNHHGVEASNSSVPSPSPSHSSAFPPPLVIGRRLMVDKAHIAAGGSSFTPMLSGEQSPAGGLAPPTRWHSVRGRERPHVHARSISSTAR
ncbi:hypothetical protein GMORB2_6106 [Geosmithia morbida]|uniref:BTB domain-containing protein n=1 Tax=Geosmithia morbida TaxID=1094350 RepID=A0A9P4YV58_9HYPO|nr:uncharacterized protein GMORB2_6106 [Geosmithia morbida]KAF4123405.1 hypothetical protein GMORB2_6106 [Geosmithia morbida]